MSETPFLTLAGKRATDAVIRVPQIGAWVADVRLDSDEVITGRVTLKVGTTSFVGTVDDKFSGAFNLRRSLRVVGGLGWAKNAPAKHWHNDAGVRVRQIVIDTAAVAGEPLEQASDLGRAGNDYVRQGPTATQPAPCSDTLRRLAPSWFVKYDGTTSTGPRPTPTNGKFDLLNFDPAQNMAEIAAEDVSAVQVGAVLTDRLERPLTVRQLEIRVEAHSARLIAWGTT